MSDDRFNQRRYFRLAYPVSLMPTMQIGERRFRVSEISEGGIRICCTNRWEFKVKEEVTGELSFVDGDAIAIEGVVLRYDRRDFVIAPIEGISFKHVVAEQRRVLAECPSVHIE